MRKKATAAAAAVAAIVTNPLPHPDNTHTTMILIADSGATKADWCLGNDANDNRTWQTEGINPFQLTEERISEIICGKLLRQLPAGEAGRCTAVHFYGAGCLPTRSGFIADRLQECFPQAAVSVCTDLLGAARAACGTEAGIACILGTGSNSCLYDGQNIVKNTPPLGYVLGDEGSGAYLGKRFVADCLKGLLPATLGKGLFSEYGINTADLLDKVYRQPAAGRFLASLVPYIHRHRHLPEVAAFLHDCFGEFFRRNVAGYGTHGLPVSFCGSVAWHFREEVEKAALEANLRVGKFVKSPIEGLKRYHFRPTPETNIHL